MASENGAGASWCGNPPWPQEPGVASQVRFVQSTVRGLGDRFSLVSLHRQPERENSMRRFLVIRFSLSGRGRVLALLAVLVALAAVFAVPASARPRGVNGQLAFGLFNPLLGDTQVNVINPDGTGQRLVQGPTETGELPRWFPDGIHVATGGAFDQPFGG